MPVIGCQVRYMKWRLALSRVTDSEAGVKWVTYFIHCANLLAVLHTSLDIFSPPFLRVGQDLCFRNVGQKDDCKRRILYISQANVRPKKHNIQQQYNINWMFRAIIAKIRYSGNALDGMRLFIELRFVSLFCGLSALHDNFNCTLSTWTPSLC